MKKNFLCLLAIFLFTASAVIAQKTPPDKTGAEDEAFKALVAKARGGDTNIDFKALRIAFSRTKAYGPYGGDRDGQKAAFDALDKKSFKDAAKKAEDMLDKNFVDMDAHVIAKMAYDGLGDKARAEFHKTMYLGLVNSIISSGDGKTEATAYIVITTHEEYIVLRALGLAMGSQSLVNKDGHAFDVLQASDPKTKETFKIFFNIDIPWKAETEMFKE